MYSPNNHYNGILSKPTSTSAATTTYKSKENVNVKDLINQYQNISRYNIQYYILNIDIFKFRKNIENLNSIGNSNNNSNSNNKSKHDEKLNKFRHEAE